MKKLRLLLISSILSFLPITSYGLIGSDIAETEHVYRASISVRGGNLTSKENIVPIGIVGDSLVYIKFMSNKYEYEPQYFQMKVGNLMIKITTNPDSFSGKPIVDTERFTKIDNTEFTPEEIRYICFKYWDKNWRKIDTDTYENDKVLLKVSGKYLYFSKK